MTQEEITLLCREIKEGFQIPPYFDDNLIVDYINRGIQYLDNLCPGTDYQSDYVARGLLKDYCHYCYYHRSNEFYQDCRNSIITWQMSKLETNNEIE